jgi:hypothetical protein
MGGPDGPRTIHCLTGPPKTFLEKKNIYSEKLYLCNAAILVDIDT